MISFQKSSFLMEFTVLPRIQRSRVLFVSSHRKQKLINPSWFVWNQYWITFFGSQQQKIGHLSSIFTKSSTQFSHKQYLAFYKYKYPSKLAWITYAKTWITNTFHQIFLHLILYVLFLRLGRHSNRSESLKCNLRLSI